LESIKILTFRIVRFSLDKLRDREPNIDDIPAERDELSQPRSLHQLTQHNSKKIRVSRNIATLGRVSTPQVMKIGPFVGAQSDPSFNQYPEIGAQNPTLTLNKRKSYAGGRPMSFGNNYETADNSYLPVVETSYSPYRKKSDENIFSKGLKSLFSPSEANVINITYQNPEGANI